ncbi:MAG TPA: DUF3047 domain-containing protein [Nitrospiraceae bacterium]|nr:DUF3047 domain-containing protein [Nitrospiraceae bacterium]
MIWNMARSPRVRFLLAFAILVWPAAVGVLILPAQAPNQVLEDFRHPDDTGWPVGWKAQRSETRAKEAYRVKTDGDQAFLAASGADQRVYKKTGWDPKNMPIISWKWRLKSAPPPESDKDDLIAAVFVSLDTDLMFIPVTTKYVWSRTKPVGTITEGGMSSASEIVMRNGTAPIGEWVDERVNAYVDFKRIHNHEPADKAWGVSLLAGPGVEVDFGTITAHSQ